MNFKGAKGDGFKPKSVLNLLCCSLMLVSSHLNSIQLTDSPCLHGFELLAYLD